MKSRRFVGSCSPSQSRVREVALGCALALPSCSAPATPINGVIVDKNGTPVADAHVRVQGTNLVARSGRGGEFRIALPPGSPGATVAAWKEGYFNGGARLSSGRGESKIVLLPLPREDDSQHAFVSARGVGPEACGRCHPALLSEWETSAHATSATNALFRASYAGTDEHGEATGGPGYRVDFPNAAGNCATCHVPALAYDAPFATRADQATGAAAEGVLCDFCHKIRASKVDDTGGRPGVLSIELVRAKGGENVLFGPLDDVIARRDSFLPLYRQSSYCAPCHNGSFWNVRAYSEFEEWAASSYAKSKVECQDCHMKAKGGPARAMALIEEGGILRNPSTLSSHAVLGTADHEFLRSSIALQEKSATEGATVRVRVSIENVAAGHHVPTGSPMRNMILVVEAHDADGHALALVSGGRVPEWAGRGSPGAAPDPCDLAGVAGKGFAKVLNDRIEYPADRPRGRSFAAAFPTPYWRPAAVASDTRIPAGETDVSDYAFDLSSAAPGRVTISTRLIYRRTFRTWGRLGTLQENDLELASSESRLAWGVATTKGERP